MTLPQVSQDADKALEEYATVVRENKELIVDLELAAKDLFHEIRKHCNHEKQEFAKHEIPSATAQADLEAVLKSQDERWKILDTKTEKLKKQLKEQWSKIEAAKEAVEQARVGSSSNQADKKPEWGDRPRSDVKMVAPWWIAFAKMYTNSWSEFPAEERASLRHYYTKKLHPNFLEAQSIHQKMLSFPNGELTMVTLYHEKSKEIVEKTIELIENRETHRSLLNAIRA